MPEPPAVSGYSFYLNVVVVSSNPVKENGSVEGEDETNGDAVPEQPQEGEGEDGVQETPGEGDGEPPLDPEKAQIMDKKQFDKHKLLLDGRAFVDSIGASITKRATAFIAEEKTKKTPDPMKFVQDSANVMNAIGGQIGKNVNKVGSSLSRRAKTFVASKTVVSRAERAVSESIPLVTEEIGVEMSISKRFQQGPVFVLEVDMKGCDLLTLLEKTMGEDKAEHYRKAREGIIALGLAEALQTFDKEILPILRTGLMVKMADIVPEKMKMKKSNADLEIECIALNDHEEAKWLYNFLEFMQQMK
uniref:Uncharacterized protein n=1 Tax=Cyclophora tenuis TaxID=216820 RepID=A0A6U1PSQ9_CYCTE|mmetsp:Transcript_15083/g.25562  ORF Transcript_15083/g.25562 Transcript_15083/m.25562 type:complete len:303 (+) Transcript_15083:96-1004(+)|eukprot:CAMPEP_0116560890 /NCGR_PEP_ID=MMETSP0397-20121206/11257_1 /TAXON_ID=216820 /ORGANISM="Cyclophora tenuis, Strain ECT3854" /LENGTH=302 /DNA_ID=CAMNT_0004086929 /DNA_START=58 /DNA_END=966 /DNA_ORIENTATION=+